MSIFAPKLEAVMGDLLQEGSTQQYAELFRYIGNPDETQDGGIECKKQS